MRTGLVVCAAAWLALASPAAPADDAATTAPLDSAISYLRERLGSRARANARSGGADLEFLLSSSHEDRRSGRTHLYLRQQIDGLEVHGAEFSLVIEPDGRVEMLGEPAKRAVLRTRPAARSGAAPRLSAGEALHAAAEALALPPGATLHELGRPGGAAGTVVFEAPELSRDPIRVELVYLNDGSSEPRLTWHAVLRTPDGEHWWNLTIDAESGELVQRNDWVAHERYEVVPPPLMSLDDGPRSVLQNEADPLASPYGWHDTNGIAGAEFSDTRGNNVFAQEDANGDDVGGLRPDGGSALRFEFPLDLSQQPGNQIDAAVTNLFYWANRVHDVLYQYGFDEAAGNFQENNYGRGGSANDAVRADAQDGAGVDNARFSTPPDGSAPRMEMFRWLQTPSPRMIVTAPPAIAGTVFGGRAQFGGGSFGLSADVVRALDPADAAGPSTTDACSPLTNAPALVGNLALVDRGDCFFVEKLAHVQAAGAAGAIVANHTGDEIIEMAGIDPQITIPALFIGQTAGASIAAQLATGVSATLISPAPRDSALDNGVMVHEYAHGVTNRLTGGRSNVDCLDESESAAMGEGWSDWFALVFTAAAGDAGDDARGISPFLVGEGAGGGIRNWPYSTSLSVAPYTYGDLPNVNQPHGGGEIWASALWGMYWELVGAHGYDPDLSAGGGGNNLALQLVIDALKIQPCDPTFVEGRDALLAADLASNGGANECAIWRAFSDRGLGVAAFDGGSATSLAVTEDFERPAHCVPEVGTLGGGIASAAMLFGSGRVQRARRLRRRNARRT